MIFKRVLLVVASALHLACGATGRNDVHASARDALSVPASTVCPALVVPSATETADAGVPAALEGAFDVGLVNSDLLAHASPTLGAIYRDCVMPMLSEHP